MTINFFEYNYDPQAEEAMNNIRLTIAEHMKVPDHMLGGAIKRRPDELFREIQSRMTSPFVAMLTQHMIDIMNNSIPSITVGVEKQL